MPDYTNSHLVVETKNIEPGTISWRSPSNLAIVKYWGKHGRQLPANPSISFTLSKAFTETILEYRPKKNSEKQVELSLLLDNRPNEAFEKRIAAYLEDITSIFPFLHQLRLDIKTTNSFPHSAGIASSASGFSALALCLCSLEKQLFGSLQDQDEFLKKASYVARLGSGSACRSVYPKAALWGRHASVEGSSDEFAIPAASHLHPVFQTFQNSILLVSTQKKAVSSTAGHALMDQHPYASARFRQAGQHILELITALKHGDLETFGRITEGEAMTLHALMMASNPPYILMQPNTINVLRRVQAFRKGSDVPLYFSLDAGPNPHLLYPEKYSEQVHGFIREELLPLCEEGRYLEDTVGGGPEQLFMRS